MRIRYSVLFSFRGDLAWCESTHAGVRFVSVLTLTHNAEVERSFPKRSGESRGSGSAVAGHPRSLVKCVGGGVKSLSLRAGVEDTAPWQSV